MTDASTAEMNAIKRIGLLGKRLKHFGVRSLYIGDGDHHSTNVALNNTAAEIGFHPELLFIEEGAEFQARCDSSKWRHDNFLGDQIATKMTHAHLFAVDDSEISKLQPFTERVSQKRVSPQTHDRIAGRIVAHISDFYHQHGRMPTFAVVYGAHHFDVPHSLRDAIIARLREEQLPVSRSCTIKIYDEKQHLVASDLHHHFFGPFRYTYGVGTALPPGVADFCNPANAVDVRGRKLDSEPGR